jgi:hypothetical protein
LPTFPRLSSFRRAAAANAWLHIHTVQLSDTNDTSTSLLALD